MRSLLLSLFIVSLVSAPVAADLLLTEVYYDHAGGDDGFEWVEILNTSPSAVDVAGYKLAWGGADYSFGTLTLQGTVAGCGTFVVGVNSVVENGAPTLNQVADFAPDLQNSGSAADGVALFAPADDPASACPLDAVIYGPSNSNSLLDETCSVGGVDVGDVSSLSSIERTSEAGAWDIQSAPDPNGVTFTFSCDQVATDEPSWSTIKSSYR